MAIVYLIIGLILFYLGQRTRIVLNKPIADMSPAEINDAGKKRMLKTVMLITGVFLVVLAMILSAISFFIVG